MDFLKKLAGWKAAVGTSRRIKGFGTSTMSPRRRCDFCGTTNDPDAEACRSCGWQWPQDRFEYGYHRLSGDFQFAALNLLEQLKAVDIDTLVDVGCSNGQVLKQLCELFKPRVAYGFEAAPETFRLAQEGCAGIENSHLFNNAVSDVEGKRKFYLSTNPAGSSLEPFDGNSGEIEVEAVRLDKWATKQGITSLDFVKIDVQGHDLAVIKGMSDLTRTVRILLVEVWFQDSTYHSPLYEDVACYLRQYGLTLYGFSCLTYYENKGLCWGDAIFVNESVRSSASAH